MNTFKSAPILFVLIAIVTVCPAGVDAWQQSDQEPAADAKAPSEAAMVLQQIREHIEAGNWQGVSNCMTDEAWDRFCSQQVVEAISVANIDADIPLPGIEEAQQAIKAALEKHGLDELEIDRPSIEIRMGHGMEDEEEVEVEKDKEAATAEDAQHEKIIAALDDSGDRMTIVGDLWKAKAASPFGVSVFLGDIKQEVADGDSVSLKISPSTPEMHDEGGLSLVIAVPPVFVDIRKEGGVWKYAGVDQEKTDEAMKNFRPPMHGGQRSDF